MNLKRTGLGLLLFSAAWLILPFSQDAAAPTHEADGFQPAGLYLSWQRDPTRTMTVDWHTLDDTRRPVVEYRREGSDGWRAIEGEQFPFPFSDRFINRVELTGLDPYTFYEFRFAPRTRVYRFRTMPENANRPVRFATGGDVQLRPDTSRTAASWGPDFMLFGGDLAYGNGDPRRVEQWYRFFENTRDFFVAPDGRLIPMVVAIGNHEVFSTSRLEAEDLDADYARREWGLEHNDAPFFNAFFPMPGVPEYGVLDFGDYLSVILLDSNHRNRVGEEQAEWLASVLEERRQVPHVFPIYHVPAYPSVRRFDGSTNVDIREHWVPLFERFGVRVAFENHDHVYKRTYPIRENRISSHGVVYLGDGTWGVNPRVVGRDHDEPAWYLKRAESVRFFTLVTVHGPHQHFLMVDHEGNVFDEYPETPRFSRVESTATAPVASSP